MDEFALSRAQGFRDVLRFEADNPWLLDYTLPQSGIPYWLVVRWPLCRMLEDKLTGSSTLENEPRPYRKIPGWLFQSVVRNPIRAKGKASDILIFATAVANFRSDGAFVNRLVDHFAGCYPDLTTIIERSNKFDYYFPRSFPRVYCHDSLTLVGSFLARLRRPSPKDSRRIAEFVEAVAKGFDFVVHGSRATTLKRVLEKSVLGDSAIWLAYSRLLDALKPKLILVEDGCYGGLSTLIVAARDRGITVAEHQHGLISKNHEAYNYHPAVHENLSRFLPGMFLSWGAWWAKQMSVPCAVRIVGNPHLNESIGLKRDSPSQSHSGAKRTFLFISAATNPVRYESFILSLSAALDDHYRILFRPHPRERSRIRVDYPGLCASDRVEIDTKRNLYDSLSEVDAVGGDMSTGAVEALAFGVPVYLLDSENTRRHLPEGFRYVSTGAELAEILPSSDSYCDLPMDEVWAPNWEQNYRCFVDEALAR